MAKVKYLLVTMPDGTVWEVPAAFIAKNRTAYYAEKEKFVEGSKEWADEYESSMDDSELMDWAASNMNWEDVEAEARRVTDPVVDYDDGWCNGDKEIVVR